MVPIARRTTARHLPQPHINTTEIRHHIINAQVTACPDCGPHTAILAGDIALLLGEITRLHKSLIRARRNAANYQAAIQAALGAADDGEPDPLGYLKDELAGPSSDIIPPSLNGPAGTPFPHKGGEAL
jgi:hypothetical protein